jgi:ribose 5-phosphate isomerase B
MTNSLIFIASDHRGFQLKTKMISWLRERGMSVRDLGPEGEARCDASDFALKLAVEMKAVPDAAGVLICGTGQVMTMTANRFQHLRAALCTSATMARLARQHNDANVLTLGAHIIGEEVAMDCLDTFLATPHLGGRYAERVKSLTNLGGL